VRRTARHLSYANVAATLALVFSMSGGALAAKHYLINSASQINPKLLKKLRGPAGMRGAQGPAGVTGLRGPDGQQGRPGPEGREGRAATIAPVVWMPLTLEHKWEIFDPMDGGPEVTKDAQGFVHLKGGIDGEASTSTQFAVLPPGFRPTTEALLVHASGINGVSAEALVDIFIEQDGAMFAELAPGNNGRLVSLEGVTFYAG
jgi:hypothetical protein